MSTTYDFVDLGTKRGGALRSTVKAAGKFGFPKPHKSRCLGIDHKGTYARQVRQLGYQFLAANILSPEFVWPTAQVYLAWNFLEHLPSITDSQTVLSKMLHYSTHGAWLLLPSFEQDAAGEGQLRKHGLRFHWTQWRGHPSHFCLSHVKEVVDELGTHTMKVRRGAEVYDSKNPLIVPIGADDESPKYKPEMGPKPLVKFSPVVIADWYVILKPKTSA